ncbi:hypothetical protein JNUCC0626_14280 [Lentzea sp. JNUCC 0626]|uniref:hypothetical protein n=1 Tax=Lentzea sp. JNUCC 0626 TaxID=3367513 RepID=UPI003748BB42
MNQPVATARTLRYSAAVGSVSAILNAILLEIGSLLWQVTLVTTFASISLLVVHAWTSRDPRPWTPRRGTGVAAGVVGMTAALVSGALTVLALSSLPPDEEGLRRTCTFPAAHRGSPALSDGERVTRTYVETNEEYVRKRLFDVRPTAQAEEVQQVACLRMITGGAMRRTCEYGDRFGVFTRPVTLYQGVWQLEVYEARTGRRLAVRDLTGDSTSGCPSSALVPFGGSPAAIYAEPSLAAVLDAVKTG